MLKLWISGFAYLFRTQFARNLSTILHRKSIPTFVLNSQNITQNVHRTVFNSKKRLLFHKNLTTENSWNSKIKTISPSGDSNTNRSVSHFRNFPVHIPWNVYVFSQQRENRKDDRKRNCASMSVVSWNK